MPTYGGPNRDITRQEIVLSEATANKVSRVIDVRDHRNIIISLIATNTPTATVKIIGTCENDVKSDASGIGTLSTDGITVKASDKDLIWDYMRLVDLNGGSDITGSTGVAYTGTAGKKLLEVNTNTLAYIAIEITGYSAGKITAKVRLSDNK